MSDEKWYSKYEYARNSGRCITNVEPTTKCKKSRYERKSEKDAIDCYRTSLANHAKSLAHTASSMTNKQLDGRLRKYGLDKYADGLKAIEKLANDILADMYNNIK